MCEGGVGAVEWFLGPFMTVWHHFPGSVPPAFLQFFLPSFLCFNSDSPGDPPTHTCHP